MSRNDGRGSEPADVSAQRDAFVQTFFKRGAEITEELIRENALLRDQLNGAEREKAALRLQLASDDTLRQALRKIEDLERDKRALLSHMESAEATSTRHVAHQAHMENEIANLANLYVALYQLHATLVLKGVTDRLRELLAQLIGGREFAVYLASEAKQELVPIASELADRSRAPRVRLRDSVQPPPGAPALIERVFLTGASHVASGPLATADSPVACVPMRIESKTIGVIVIYSVLPQKERFLPVDHELFKLLGAHAATALLGALLFARGGGNVPDVESFLPTDLSEPSVHER